MRLSFSKLSLYEFCPYAYRLRYVERVPTPFAPHLAVGAIVHTVLQRFLQRLNETGQAARGDLHALHAAYWRDAPRLDRERFPDIWSRGHTLLDGYWTANAGALGRPIMLEQYFRIPLPAADEHTLEGVIDRVDERADGLEVIDYKSGKRPAQLSRRLHTQLHTYALALERGFGRRVTRLTAYFLHDNQALSSAPDAEVVREVSTRYQSLARNVNAAAYDPTPGRRCNACDFRRRCPHRWREPT